MYEPVECFWVEPTGKAIVSMRRSAQAEEGCEHPEHEGRYGYHSKSVELGEDFDVRWTEEADGRFVASIDPEEFAEDPRWPTHCDCGYEFKAEDGIQVVQEPIMESADGRRAFTSPAYGRKPTPGAMFETYWRPALRKEDGRAISAVCPNGEVWCIDEEASSGGFWERTGEPPNLTVTPSIVAGDYHGHLTAGSFTAG